MGARSRPGSVGRRDQGGGERRFDHLAEYGRGRIIDEATGEYEWYEIPEDDARTVTWAAILDQPRLIAADFLSEYGIRLSQVGNDLAWRDFALMVEGLLAADTRLARRLARDQDPAAAEAPDVLDA